MLGVVVAPELPDETWEPGDLLGRSEKPARLLRVVLAKLPAVPHHKKLHHHTPSARRWTSTLAGTLRAEFRAAERARTVGRHECRPLQVSVTGSGLLVLAGEGMKPSGEHCRVVTAAAACALLCDHALDQLLGHTRGACVRDRPGDHRLVAGTHQPHGTIGPVVRGTTNCCAARVTGLAVADPAERLVKRVCMNAPYAGFCSAALDRA